MNPAIYENSQPDSPPQALLDKLDEATRQLEMATAIAKPGHAHRVLDISRRVILAEGGCAALEARASRMDAGGLFEGTDWISPQILQPNLSASSLTSPVADTVMLETLSTLRLLPVATGGVLHDQISAEQAHHHVAQVLAMNLVFLFTPPSEAERETQGRLAQVPRILFAYLADRIGYEHVIDQLIDEIWRILQQRPIQVDSIRQMVTQISICRNSPDIDLGNSGQGAERLISSLFGPTQSCREDPGLEVYRERLQAMDTVALRAEAIGFSRAMHDTGLVSPYHAALMKHLKAHAEALLADAMGLSSTGRDCMLCYRELVLALIDEAIHPDTPQSILGLALLLERGILYQPPMAPSLWRQITLRLSDESRERLRGLFGDAVAPRNRLLAGMLCMLGLPLGVGQGNNPTCQSARALSMWAYNDPDYLMQIVVWAARDNEVIMHFEGESISSKESIGGVATQLPMDLDPVSLLVVPHLDRIYSEMMRRCYDRPGDPHQWVNPEFHGWSTNRGFRINVDVPTGKIVDLEGFLRDFHAAYHPYYNGNQPLIHPQPAGVAVTDSAARFIGWHAITIQRVALDPENEMRVYFFNPNNDSGQDWGDGLLVDTAGKGERSGESSLTFKAFASRIYIFHCDPLEYGNPEGVPANDIEEVIGYVRRSWGATRM
jgi:hypothetical protein